MNLTMKKSQTNLNYGHGLLKNVNMVEVQRKQKGRDVSLDGEQRSMAAKWTAWTMIRFFISEKVIKDIFLAMEKNLKIIVVIWKYILEMLHYSGGGQVKCHDVNNWHSFFGCTMRHMGS